MMNNYRNDELYHYGVLGQKWGIRRGRNKLRSATSKEERDNAISLLDKHKTKSENKLAKLKKQSVRLDKNYDRAVEKTDVRVAKLRAKADRYRNKSIKWYVTDRQAFSYQRNAIKLDARASKASARSIKYKAKVHENARLQSVFKQGLSEIDRAKLEYGKAYLDNMKNNSK